MTATITLNALNELGKEISLTQEIIMGAFEGHINHYKNGRLIFEVPDTAELNTMYAKSKEMIIALQGMGVDDDQLIAAAKGKLNV